MSVCSSRWGDVPTLQGVKPGAVETVTVLFTDAVASTATRSRLRDEAADARLVELERVAGQAVTEAGGTVVKGLGDGIMATFAGVTAALDAAVVIQRATRGVRRRRPGSALSIRVGISSGDVLRVGADCFGTAVV